MPSPMPGFVRSLKAYDKDLRVRWAPLAEKWFIEKKCDARLPSWVKEQPSPFGRSGNAQDLWEGWKEGYVHVLSVPLEHLAWQIVEPALRQADIQAHGTTAAMNRALDRLDEEWEAQTDRTIANWTEAASSDFSDRMAWLDGNRVAVTTPAEPAAEQRDGYRVRDRRIHAA